MRRQDAEIPMPDGRSRGTLHLPDGDGPWPGVLVFPDAGGARETFRQLAGRLAGLGYVVLVPDRAVDRDRRRGPRWVRGSSRPSGASVGTLQRLSVRRAVAARQEPTARPPGPCS
jgi:dienelactone hydrolase